MGAVYIEIGGLAMNLLKDNKGITYIIVSSLLVVVLIGIFFASKKYTYQDQTELYTIKIRAMNDFLKNFNTDVHRATHVSAFRAMIALEDHVAGTGIFLTNVSESFKETFYEGTINGVQVNIMSNSSFEDYVNKIQLIAKEVGFTLNASVDDVKLSQSSPWNIDVAVSIIINMSDARKKVSWNTRQEFYTSVPIENLRDPMYGVYTLNKLPNSIRQCNFTTLVTSNNDTSNLELCINQSAYFESNQAPNFLMRFEGNFSTDLNSNGIESIVYIPGLAAQELPVSINDVKIDYIYFSKELTDKICDIQHIHPDTHLVIPSNRVVLYQISGLNYSITCP
jgi:hypothetical protein